MARKRILTVNPDSDTERRIAIEQLDDTGNQRRYRVTLDPQSEGASVVEVTATRLGDLGLGVLTSDGRAQLVEAHASDGDVEVALDGRTWSGQVLDERAMRRRALGGGRSGASGPALKVPMAGKVIAVSASPGASVNEGDPVAIVEAMKMENVIKAHRAGVVTEVNIAVGDSVNVGAVLMTIDADES